MRNQSLITPVTDLHCHILPGVDDGAADLSVTQKLLDMEEEQGVTQIAFTPHFYADRMSLGDFLRRRRDALSEVLPECRGRRISVLAGSEVRMMPELLNEDLSSLSLSDTGYLLLEWPFYGFPIWGDDLVDQVGNSGSIPIFAHIERYDYFFRTPQRLDPYLESGALMQVNATSLLEAGTQRQILRLIRDGYVHLIASDAHSPKRRPVLLAEAYEVVTRRLGERTADRLKENADDVFHGQEIEPVSKRGRGRH